MAEKSTKGEKSFADYVREAPSLAEAAGTVSLTGVVLRSDKEDQFVLAMAGGQTVELPTAAVKSFSVVQETGQHRVAQLEVAREQAQAALGRAGGAVLKSVTADNVTTAKEPTVDTLKEVIKDPIQDITRKELIKEAAEDSTALETIDPFRGVAPGPELSAAGGPAAAPFVLATPHHAPEAALALQGAGAQVTVKELIADNPVTLKEITKDPIQDLVTRKELTKDPILDPVTWVENQGQWTTVEGIDPRLPGGGVINPR